MNPLRRMIFFSVIYSFLLILIGFFFVDHILRGRWLLAGMDAILAGFIFWSLYD